MTSRPPSTPRVVRALIGIGARRWRNRIFGRLAAAFRKKHAKPRRQATAPKRAALGSLQVAMGVLMVVGAFGMAAGLVMRIGEQIDLRAVPDKLALGGWIYDYIRNAEKTQRLLIESRRPPRPPADSQSSSRPGEPAATAPASAPAGASPRVRRKILRDSAFMFSAAGRRLAGPFGDRLQAEQKVRRAYLAGGLDAFYRVPDREGNPLAAARAWADPPRRHALTNAFGLVLTGLVLMLLFRSFAAANLDLATPQWSVEWFFTFPIPAGAIFAARLGQLTLLNAFSWLTVFPLMTLVCFSAGFGLWAPAPALGVTLAVNAVVASVQVVGETWMRRHLSRGRLNNVVGLCTILQMLFFIATMAVAATPEATRWLVAAAQRLPVAARYLPTFLPMGLCRPDTSAWPVALGMPAVALAMPLAAAALCHRLVRGGLIAQSGTYAGRRGRQTRPARAGMLRGILGKELLLLARDRSFLAQTIILPVVLCLFQVLLNPALFRAAADDLQHATAVAFGTGAYVVLISGARLLVGEVRSGWLLYTLPQRLDKLLFRKVVLWAGFGTAFATIVWLLLAMRHGRPGPMDALNAAIAIAGVGIFGCVSAGLSALGTDATMERPRVGPSIVYLNMLLGGVYISAVYAPSVWQKSVIVALFILVACAVWQKVRDRLPYLLDPTELPPPALGLSDALIAVFAFFATQSLLLVLLLQVPISLGAVLAISYAAAAVIVGGLSLLIFWRRRVPDLLVQLGLRRPPDHPGRAPWAAAALRGLACGALVGVVGIGYLIAVQRVDWLRQMADKSPLVQIGEAGGHAWIVLLAVLGAPPLEEFLFRGLLFRGLSRSARPAVAVVASAAVFAAVHSPVSFVPVFCLGVAAALSFRATGLLIAPIIAHMTYNTVVMAAAVFLR